jgi:hypothetical protein
MGAILTSLLLLLLIGAIAAPIAYFQIRKTFREQKNFERGLKMVPLLIQLPPSSDDTDDSNRDSRDVVDENVSKAQILYGILSSIFKKGLKGKFYGQRHLSLEIVAVKGSVQFYAAVPIALIDVVKQAVVSAYPSARLEEIEEHNIFNQTGKLSGTSGGEMSLKEHYAYPIATYQDIKRDPIQSMLNSLSTLENEDGAGIQILLRPAPKEWRSTASSIASSKRKGKKDRKGLEAGFYWLQQLFSALTSPPEGKEGSDSSGADLSPMDQNILNSIDEKTSNPGFETLIRVVASSNTPERSQAVLSNITASFSLFDSPGRNGFYFTPAKDIESFVTAYILRIFPQAYNKNILNTIELATLYHFPDQKNIPTSQLERQHSKQVDGPRNMADEGLLLGYNVFRGNKKPIRIAHEDRARHMYVVGQTGVGKSQFLENLALQDMIDGTGFAFVDPHGDTAERLLAMVPKERTEDVIYFCPAEMDYPMGLNLFEFHTEEQQDFLIQEAINMLYKLYDPQRQGIIGPRYEHWFRMAAKTVMANPAGGTFIDIPKVFTDNQYAKELIKHVKDQVVLDFWHKEMASTTDYHKSEILGWFVSKFGAFLANDMMRNIIGQSKSAFNLRDIMDNKKILLVNLSKGRTGDLNSKLLGMVFVMKFQAAAMSRSDVPEHERQDFALYVDEFQNFSTDSFATILSEARKYHLNLIVANQFTTQLSDEIRDAVFGNVGTIVSFRVGQNDVDGLTRYFQPLFGTDDLLRVPNWNTVVRTLVNGVPTQPFSMATLPPLGEPNPQLGKALKQLSFAKYGKPKKKAEELIFARLATQEPTNPSAGMRRSGAAGAFGGQAPGAKSASTGSSFLDDWLAKRKRMQPAAGQKPGTPASVSPPAGRPSVTSGTAVSASEAPSPSPSAKQQTPQTTTGNATTAKPADSDSKQTAPAEKTDQTDDVAQLRNQVEQEISEQPQNQQKDEGEVKVGAHHDDVEEHENTIYIDKEGKLHQESPSDD